MSDERAKSFFLSEYQDQSSLPVLQAAWEAGYRAVHIRASSGLHADALFEQHWANAGQVGFVRSAWHYLVQQHSGQAALFRSVVGDRDPELGIYGDFEEGDLTLEKCDSFLQATDPNFGMTCHVYTRATWLDPRGKPPWQAQGRLLWVAHFGVEQPTLPQCYTTYEWHQHRCAVFPPFPEQVCEDRYNGTLADLYTRYGNAEQQAVAELLQAQAKNEEVAAHIGTALALLQGGR